MKTCTKFGGALLIQFACGQAAAVDYEQVIYYHNDALGSPIAATDKDGSLLWREVYSPYGSRLQHESRETDCDKGTCLPVESPWDEKQWFTGKLEETRTGLQYFGARWYEPEIGRFLSPDPVVFRDQNVFSFNRYQYANNNPFIYIDPDGRDTISVTGTLHVPGSLLYAVGISEVPVSGFTFGAAISFPGFWGNNNDFGVGVMGAVDIPVGDIGLGKASVDLGYSKGSVSDLAGGGLEISATVGTFNGGISLDPETREITGLKFGRGFALGRISNALQRLADGINDPKAQSIAKKFLNNNLSITYQESVTKSISSSNSHAMTKNRSRNDE